MFKLLKYLSFKQIDSQAQTKDIKLQSLNLLCYSYTVNVAKGLLGPSFEY